MRETSTGGREEWYSRTRRTWQRREDRHSRWNSRTTPTMAMNGVLQARLSLLKWLPLSAFRAIFFPGEYALLLGLLPLDALYVGTKRDCNLLPASLLFPRRRRQIHFPPG